MLIILLLSSYPLLFLIFAVKCAVPDLNTNHNRIIHVTACITFEE